MKKDLSRLFRPRSIVVMGGGWARNVIEQNLKSGYDGELWPVHPTATDMHGVRCFASLDALPGSPDAAFVGINREASVTAVRKLAAINCGGVICFASGFSEAAAEDEGASKLEQELLQAAGEMPLVGPNCYGLVNCIAGATLWPDQHGCERTDRGVALLTQSSNIAINLSMQKRGLPIAYVLTAGNQSQISLGELGESLLADENVTALGLYIESVGDIRAFESMARLARSLGKPVVVIKAGRSAAAREAMISHTNSLSGAASATASFLRRLGIVQVDSLSVLIETLKVVHLFGLLPSARLQSMSCSGGEAGLVSDTATLCGVDFPALNDLQTTALRKALGPRVALANPLDYHTYIWGDQSALQSAFAAMMTGPADMTALILDFPRDDRCDASSWQPAIDALTDAAKEASRRTAIIATLPENMPEADAQALFGRGILPLCGVDDALRAIAAAASVSSVHRLPNSSVEPLLLPRTGTDQELKNHEPGFVTLNEREAKQQLAEYGLAVPRSAVSSDQTHLLQQSQSLNFPVVLKFSGVAHKSDIGGVVLGIDSTESLKKEISVMQRRLGVADLLVEEQIQGVLAELLVSVVRDPVYGLMLTLAAGGVHTEILKDTQHLLLPFEQTDVVEQLQRLSIAPLLNGYRGKPAVDLNALVSSIMRLQKFCTEIADEIRELEINPMLCTHSEVIVADALLVLNRAS